MLTRKICLGELVGKTVTGLIELPDTNKVGILAEDCVWVIEGSEYHPSKDNVVFDCYVSLDDKCRLGLLTWEERDEMLRISEEKAKEHEREYELGQLAMLKAKYEKKEVSKPRKRKSKKLTVYLSDHDTFEAMTLKEDE